MSRTELLATSLNKDDVLEDINVNNVEEFGYLGSIVHQHKFRRREDKRIGEDRKLISILNSVPWNILKTKRFIYSIVYSMSCRAKYYMVRILNIAQKRKLISNGFLQNISKKISTGKS